MTTVREARLIPTDAIHVPAQYQRHGDAVEDDKLRNSIQRGGIQVPLVVSALPSPMASGKQYVLIDGSRRLQIAQYLQMPEVPCVVDEIPAGVSADEYRNRVRFILDVHRQDLLPSQRAVLIRNLKDRFSMNNKQVGEYLGVDATTIGNWLLIDRLIPDVVQQIDAGTVKLHAARALDGMSEEGQREVWRREQDSFRSLSAGALHKHIRRSYSPETYPNFYNRPEDVITRLQRPATRRKTKTRPIINAGEQRALLQDLKHDEMELKANRERLKELDHELRTAGRIINEIMANSDLRALVPEEIREQFSEFVDFVEASL